MSLLQALLASQLDGRIAVPYAAIFVPLHLAIVALMASTITRTPGNPCMSGGLQSMVIRNSLASFPDPNPDLFGSGNEASDSCSIYMNQCFKNIHDVDNVRGT